SLGGERVYVHYALQDRRRAKVENDNRDDRWNELLRIDGPKLSSGDSIAQYFSEFCVDGTKVVLGDPLHLGHTARAGANPFTLNHARKMRIGSNVIEIGAEIVQQDLTRRSFHFKHRNNRIAQAAEYMVKHRFVNGFFVFEVVVEECLIHMRRLRDGV